MNSQPTKEQYLLFAGNCYYAHGGADDFRGFFDSVELAVKAYSQLVSAIADGNSIDQWAHITDGNLKKIAECFFCELRSDHPEWDSL